MTREEAAALLGMGRADVDEWLPRRRRLRRLRRTAGVDRAEVGRLLRVAERLA
ncbi:hypothetical protein [Nocardioides bruguierae]|uniref:Uncharacterized protein n=1 Tax=Nocardioides bruguierae TaxID=2945102 RepID=A0A9X2D7Q9_9ACTN|nr:hypothetical protein [Nocardioides bruguierae]MCM0620716.1 hypothetical protein [Nocardioides bruguierae]